MSDQAFDDADALPDTASDADLASTVASLVRADLGGDQRGAVLRAFSAAAPPARIRFARAWNDAMDLDGLGDWIASDGARRSQAEALAPRLTPPDPAATDNEAVLAQVAGFSSWEAHAYPLLVVPGYTPTDATPAPGVSDVARRRLELAASAFAAGTAPFVLVSGGNVHPPGTPFSEGVEMRKALLGMSVPAARILVDARARSSMTNLRNAGRVLLRLRLPRALVITLGGGVAGTDLFGQDFYFANPTLSTFHARCESELGYRVGDLQADGDSRIAYVPAPEVARINFRDALDP
jgi:hypothetical protein